MPSRAPTLRTTSALLAVFMATFAALAACGSPEPQTVVVEKEVIKEVVVEVPAQDVNIEATVEARLATALATAAPQAVEAALSATPTPASTPTAATPRPTAKPRVSEDVVIHIGSTHADGKFLYGSSVYDFSNAKVLLEYLHKLDALTSAQMRAALTGEAITVSGDKVSVAIKLLDSKGENYLEDYFGISNRELDRILRYFDESLLDSALVARAAQIPATPRVSEEVTISQGSDTTGSFGYEVGGYISFRNAGDLLDYLLKEGVLTSAQKRAVRSGDTITVSGDKVTVAIYKLLESKGENYLREQFAISESQLNHMLRNFDESLLDSAAAASGQDGYIVIRDGSLETVVTDGDGNTTRVRIDTVDAQEFLDYLLSQGKITVEQHDAYGDSRELELSLKDAPDLFDFAASDDGPFVGIDKNDLDYIRRELLPLFSFGD